MTTQTGRDQSPEPLSEDGFDAKMSSVRAWGMVITEKILRAHDAALRAELAAAREERDVWQMRAEEAEDFAADGNQLNVEAEARAERAELLLAAEKAQGHDAIARLVRAEARADRREKEFVSEWNLRIKRDGELARAEGALERCRAALESALSDYDLFVKENPDLDPHWHPWPAQARAALADSPAPHSWQHGPGVERCPNCKAEFECQHQADSPAAPEREA